jgi:hypothetical protein
MDRLSFFRLPTHIRPSQNLLPLDSTYIVRHYQVCPECWTCRLAYLPAYPGPTSSIHTTTTTYIISRQVFFLPSVLRSVSVVCSD